MELGKIIKHYTNSGLGNYNVETGIVKKKKKPTVTIMKGY
jgi:hypothetical protein